MKESFPTNTKYLPISASFFFSSFLFQNKRLKVAETPTQTGAKGRKTPPHHLRPTLHLLRNPFVGRGHSSSPPNIKAPHPAGTSRGYARGPADINREKYGGTQRPTQHSRALSDPALARDVI